MLTECRSVIEFINVMQYMKLHIMMIHISRFFKIAYYGKKDPQAVLMGCCAGTVWGLPKVAGVLKNRTSPISAKYLS
jgi:hypothetical protein